MPVSPARAAAFEILLRVEREQSYASELLHSVRFANLSASDHGLTTELVMGALRWRSLIDRRLAGASSQKLERLDPEVLIALRLGVYQLHFLSRIPARAAIFESVELVKGARKRSAAPFVNAVLRKIGSTSPEVVLDEIRDAGDPKKLAESSAHPEWLVARWVERYGLAETRRICLHDQSVPATALHVLDGDAAQELAGAGVQLSPGLLVSSARRVISGDVTKTQAYREGHVSIQDEASQLVALLVGRGETDPRLLRGPGQQDFASGTAKPAGHGRSVRFSSPPGATAARSRPAAQRARDCGRCARVAFPLRIRSHPGGCSLLRHRHTRPQSRDQMAAQTGGSRRSPIAPDCDSAVGTRAVSARRATRLLHVLAGT